MSFCCGAGPASCLVLTWETCTEAGPSFQEQWNDSRGLGAGRSGASFIYFHRFLRSSPALKAVGTSSVQMASLFCAEHHDDNNSEEADGGRDDAFMLGNA